MNVELAQPMADRLVEKPIRDLPPAHAVRTRDAHARRAYAVRTHLVLTPSADAHGVPVRGIPQVGRANPVQLRRTPQCSSGNRNQNLAQSMWCARAVRTRGAHAWCARAVRTRGAYAPYASNPTRMRRTQRVRHTNIRTHTSPRNHKRTNGVHASGAHARMRQTECSNQQGARKRCARVVRAVCTHI